MNLYETAFILKPTLTPDETQARIAMFKDIITNQGGEICAMDEWGSKKLAYKIEKFERGYYVIIYFKAPGKAILELERVYTITEDILRFITIKYSRQAEIKAWQKMADKANGKSEAKSEPKAAAPVEA
jgi:small subunit ribosomal protein S6